MFFVVGLNNKKHAKTTTRTKCARAELQLKRMLGRLAPLAEKIIMNISSGAWREPPGRARGRKRRKNGQRQPAGLAMERVARSERAERRRRKNAREKNKKERIIRTKAKK